MLYLGLCITPLPLGTLTVLEPLDLGISKDVRQLATHFGSKLARDMERTCERVITFLSRSQNHMVSLIGYIAIGVSEEVGG